MFKRIIATLICVTFSLSNLQYAQSQASPAIGGDFSVNQLPVPGTMVGISTSFAPLALKGLIVNPQKPLEFQFIVDTGNSNVIPANAGIHNQELIKQQVNQLVKYFLAGLTIPEGDLWVNLSPYEKNRMVPEALGQTDLGRDLLAQDYILKQLTASLIYPEKDLGKAFWSRVYAKAQAQFGTTNIPVNTFNKVWILPDQAQVYENANAAYVTKSTLKVMLDEDYTALQKHNLPPLFYKEGARGSSKDTTNIASQIIRQIILPEIEKEVNTGKNFAPLRQIYQALILAKWYKETIQNGLLEAVYTNKNKVAGVNVNDPKVKEEIYNRYLQAYKKGAFNYIKEVPTPDGQVVPRKYFSGGFIFQWKVGINRKGSLAMIRSSIIGLLLAFIIALTPTGSINAQPAPTTLSNASPQTLTIMAHNPQKKQTPDTAMLFDKTRIERWASQINGLGTDSELVRAIANHYSGGIFLNLPPTSQPFLEIIYLIVDHANHFTPGTFRGLTDYQQKKAAAKVAVPLLMQVASAMDEAMLTFEKIFRKIGDHGYVVPMSVINIFTQSFGTSVVYHDHRINPEEIYQKIAENLKRASSNDAGLRMMYEAIFDATKPENKNKLFEVISKIDALILIPAEDALDQDKVLDYLKYQATSEVIWSQITPAHKFILKIARKALVEQFAEIARILERHDELKGEFGIWQVLLAPDPMMPREELTQLRIFFHHLQEMIKVHPEELIPLSSVFSSIESRPDQPGFIRKVIQEYKSRESQPILQIALDLLLNKYQPLVEAKLSALSDRAGEIFQEENTDPQKIKDYQSNLRVRIAQMRSIKQEWQGAEAVLWGESTKIGKTVFSKVHLTDFPVTNLYDFIRNSPPISRSEVIELKGGTFGGALFDKGQPQMTDNDKKLLAENAFLSQKGIIKRFSLDDAEKFITDNRIGLSIGYYAYTFRKDQIIVLDNSGRELTSFVNRDFKNFLLLYMHRHLKLFIGEIVEGHEVNVNVESPLIVQFTPQRLISQNAVIDRRTGLMIGIKRSMDVDSMNIDSMDIISSNRTIQPQEIVKLAARVGYVIAQNVLNEKHGPILHLPSFETVLSKDPDLSETPEQDDAMKVIESGAHGVDSIMDGRVFRHFIPEVEIRYNGKKFTLSPGIESEVAGLNSKATQQLSFRLKGRPAGGGLFKKVNLTLTLKSSELNGTYNDWSINLNSSERGQLKKYIQMYEKYGEKLTDTAMKSHKLATGLLSGSLALSSLQAAAQGTNETTNTVNANGGFDVNKILHVDSYSKARKAADLLYFGMDRLKSRSPEVFGALKGDLYRDGGTIDMELNGTALIYVQSSLNGNNFKVSSNLLYLNGHDLVLRTTQGLVQIIGSFNEHAGIVDNMQVQKINGLPVDTLAKVMPRDDIDRHIDAMPSKAERPGIVFFTPDSWGALPVSVGGHQMVINFVEGFAIQGNQLLETDLDEDKGFASGTFSIDQSGIRTPLTQKEIDSLSPEMKKNLGIEVSGSKTKAPSGGTNAVPAKTNVFRSSLSSSNMHLGNQNVPVTTVTRYDSFGNQIKGGIDLNQINVLRKGKIVNVQFDPAQLNQLEQGGFEGFSFKIESMTRITSPFQLLGINTPAKEPEMLAKV